MMSSKQKIKENFSLLLTAGLLSYYQKIPSAAFLAKEFNLRALHSEPISQESARKWLRGQATPELEKLFILQTWLQIDLNSLNIHADQPLANSSATLGIDLNVDKRLYLKKTDELKKTLELMMQEITDLKREIIKK